MFVTLTSEKQLWFVDKRMTEVRSAILQGYLLHFFEPALCDFPELIGLVHLSLQNDGFFFRTVPAFQIVVNATMVAHSTEEKLRFATAYMLSHFLLYLRGYELESTTYTEKYYDKRAVLFAFSRGYAFDYLAANIGGCKKEYCDFNAKWTNFKCCELLSVPCRACEAPPIQQLADVLQHVTLQLNFEKKIDYKEVVQRAWAELE